MANGCMIDAHIHSSVSFDSDTPMRDMALASIEKGVEGVCFTDHYDVIDSGGKFVPEYDWSFAHAAHDEAKKAVGEGFMLNFGLELGNAPAGFSAAEGSLNEPDIDFVLGSIHNASARLAYKDYYYVDYTSEELCYFYLDDYFSQLEQLVAWGRFDSLAHVPYPLRYMVERDKQPITLERYYERIDAMLLHLARNDKALEVNTGKTGRIMPEYPYLLERFHALGGKLVTVGTDAHSIAQTGLGLKGAYELLKQKGFSSVACFKRRKPEMIRIE